MAKNTSSVTVENDANKSTPLTAAEKAALERAKADVAAGRVHDHDDVAKWLRRRAADIVKRARNSAKPR